MMIGNQNIFGWPEVHGEQLHLPNKNGPKPLHMLTYNQQKQITLSNNSDGTETKLPEYDIM